MNDLDLAQRLFERTRHLDPAARRAALAADGAPDGLRALVERLVAADTAADGPLDRSAPERLAATLPPAEGDEDLTGTTLPPYRFDARLRDGGMGSVYRATMQLDADIEREVAIKVLRRHLATADAIARFRHEQRTLARLRHEHIVAFVDAGALPDGRPFLVMERVDGEPLPEACAALPRAARLERFARVLAAVAHAHECGVVHADLKPDNLLVTPAGGVRLLDFGVSVLTRDDAHRGADAMTLAYASPEQRRGEAATTRSDVYALGVLLAEVLAAGGGDREPNGRELDAIVARATAAAPGERYASVDAFAADLRAHGTRRPVAAVGGGAVYRLRCFARRRPLGFVLAAAAGLAAFAAIGGIEVGRQRARAEASRGWGAHVQAKLAGAAIAAALRDTLRDGWPEARRAAEAWLRERATTCPETEGLVRLALAEASLAADDVDGARAQLERAQELIAGTRELGAADGARAEALARQLSGR